MKRVAVIVHGGLDPEHEGVRVPFLADLLARTSQHHDIEVFVPRTHKKLPETEMLGRARLRRVGDAGTRDPVLRAASLFLAVLGAHRRFRFNAVHGVWALPGGAVATSLGRVLRLPSIVSLHGAETACVPEIGYGDLARPVHRRIVHAVCSRASVLVLLSGAQREALAAGRVRHRAAVVIPPGADCRRFASHDSGDTDPELRLLHVANLTPVKDQSTLLRAFAFIRRSARAHLRIVGADYLGGAVQREARALGLDGDITFTGYVPHSEMPAQYAWAHVLLQTSLHEASGVAVVEAAAAGAAVCGTRTGTVADLAPDAATAVAVRDAEGLALAVLALAADPARRAAQCAAARAWAEKHDIDAAARSLGDVYDRACT